MLQTYLDIAAKKRANQLSQIPEEWRLAEIPSAESVKDALRYIRDSGLLSLEELSITEATHANTLLRKLANGDVSSEKVVTAFAKRAAFVHQLTTCCTEIFFEQAIRDAKRLDRVLERTGKPVGPLHGLPISLKDAFAIQGQDTSMGWAGLLNQPASEDSVTAAMLRKLGAVLYVKTNVPQSMMMSDSYNHVFGQTLNPLNRLLMSGGSSGGESTLISGRGSILGVGTDVGGSVRIPAALCGLYGLSATTIRHPYDRRKQRVILSTAGPIASDLASIETYMGALPLAKPWESDALMVPMPWRTELCSFPLGCKLKIGFVVDDGVVKPQPPIKRAMSDVVAALKHGGHEVIEWDASSHGYAYELWKKGILSDGGRVCDELCEMTGEPLIQGMLVGTKADLLDTTETHQLLADIDAYRNQFLRRWHEANLDALIMPVTPWAGFKPKTWVKSNQYVGYSTLCNLLDWPGLAIPVTTARAERDLDPATLADWENHTPRNVADGFNKDQYDPSLVEGIPVGVQVLAGKFGEEQCIAVARVVECLLNEVVV